MITNCKKISFCLLCLLIIACVKPIPTYYSQDRIDKYSKVEKDVPSEYGFLIVFIRFSDNQVGRTNINLLRNIYLKAYSHTYQTFNIFLSDALNQKIVFPKDPFDKADLQSFILDKEVEKTYNKVPLIEFIREYSSVKNDKQLVIKKEYSGAKLSTILYYFSITNYLVTFDDNIGVYKASKG